MSAVMRVALPVGATGRWRNGDFNYDSTVDFNDLVSLAQNYGNTLLDNGTLECSYHGFTFDTSGKCVVIPSQTDLPIPSRAGGGCTLYRLIQGIQPSSAIIPSLASGPMRTTCR